jgi:hypothetical protein
MRRMRGRVGGRGRLATALALAATLLAACGTPQRGTAPAIADPARAVVRQAGYTITLALVPLAEIGEVASAGTIGGVGYRLEVAGPVAVRVSLETFRLFRPGLASHETIDCFTLRREPGQPVDLPFAHVEGVIALPDEARAGDEVRLLAATEIAGGPFVTSPSVWLRLEAGPGGALRGVPAWPTLGLPSAFDLPVLTPVPVRPSAIPPTATPRATPVPAVTAAVTDPVATSAPTRIAPAGQGPPPPSAGAPLDRPVVAACARDQLR